VFDQFGGEASVIDPGADAEKILAFLSEKRLKVKNIFLTHGHFDHILAVQQVQEKTGARIVIHEADAGCLQSSSQALYNSIMREPFRVSRADICLHGGEKTSYEIEYVELQSTTSNKHAIPSQTLCYAKTTDMHDNRFRNVLLKMSTPMYFGLGTLHYTLASANFSTEA
jgi:ribonuclease BN (tRNA processing enzyme)